ncbi:MAG: hypothetical protein V9G14_16970 [Cypionkella sp.]
MAASSNQLSWLLTKRLILAEQEWADRNETDLNDYWPRQECWDAYMMRANGGVNRGWGYTHWWKMFSPRQLLIHSHILRSLMMAVESGWPLDAAEQALGAAQQYLRNQCMFAFWHRSERRAGSSNLSNDNYHPKQTTIENNLLAPLGYGNWASCRSGVIDALESVRSPWESEVAVPGRTRAERVFTGEPVVPAEVDLCMRRAQPTWANLQTPRSILLSPTHHSATTCSTATWPISSMCGCVSRC